MNVRKLTAVVVAAIAMLGSFALGVKSADLARAVVYCAFGIFSESTCGLPRSLAMARQREAQV